MPSGPTRLIYNTRERLLSTDANRAQAFSAASQQEAWRARYNDAAANWRLYPGLSAQLQSINAPLYGEVYSGLFVRPDAGSYLTVDPGVAMLIDPTGAGLDDSPYLYCKDPGVSTPGVLMFTANPTFSTLRWDVIECQPVDTVLEQSSRDQYNPATGLFVPVLVDKVTATRLTYRIRLGTPGGGFPGGAAGWMPLAVCAVRDGATSFAQVDFYDVRPLVSERVRPQPITDPTEGLVLPGEQDYYSFAGNYFGYSESEFGGYLMGGALCTSVPANSLANFGNSASDQGGDRGSVSRSNNANLGSYALSNRDMVHLAALIPQPPAGQGIIPRWARYSELPLPSLGRRVPNGSRGIYVITTDLPGPNNLFVPTSFPAECQLGVNGIGPLVAMATTFDAAAYGYAIGRNRQFDHSNNFVGNPWSFLPTSSSTDFVYWDLTAGVQFPHGAKALKVSFRLTCTALAPPFNFLINSRGNGFVFASIAVTSGYGSTGASISGQSVHTATVMVPIVQFSTPYPTAPVTSWGISVTPAQGSPQPVTFNTASLYIHGWEF